MFECVVLPDLILMIEFRLFQIFFTIRMDISFLVHVMRNSFAFRNTHVLFLHRYESFSHEISLLLSSLFNLLEVLVVIVVYLTRLVKPLEVVEVLVGGAIATQTSEKVRGLIQFDI